MPSVGKSSPDRLQIADSAISKQPVHPVAAYSGALSEHTLDEFQRRYGPSDYVIIEHKGQDGTPEGRVYSWPDGTDKSNSQDLVGVLKGMQAKVVAPDGKVRFQGEIRAVHDFIRGEVVGESLSPDGKRKAVLQKAGWSDTNLLSVVDVASGKERQLRALGIDGYRYVEVRWLSPDVLFEAEANRDEVGLYAVDLRKQVPTSVLLDGNAAARDLREAGEPVRSGDGAVTLKTYSWEQDDVLRYTLEAEMADGPTRQLNWQARLAVGKDGTPRLIDRAPVP